MHKLMLKLLVNMRSKQSIQINVMSKDLQWRKVEKINHVRKSYFKQKTSRHLQF